MKNLFTYRHPLIGFNDLPFIVIGIPIVAILVTMIFFGMTVQDATLCTFSNFIPSFISTGYFWLGDRWITIRMRRRFPLASQTSKRLWTQGLIIVLYTAAMAIVLKSSEGAFDHRFHSADLPHPGFIKSFVACLFATIPITAIYEAAYFIHNWKKSVAETERLAHTTTRSQLEALRNQVNPHFLFNSLNTLASIIPDQPDDAVQFTLKLSQVYRSILDLKDKQVVTLQEELTFLENYIFLCKTRFGQSISFDIRIDEHIKNHFLVPLTLQMLLENAIKHNVVSQRRPLHIEVYNEGADLVCMRNNVQEKSSEVEGTGTGLKNIRERYQLTFGMPVVVIHTEQTFVAKLPILSIHDHTRTPH
jgi:two-component system, LytTR family, sensor kinase